MSGLNETAALKIGHPGLGTTATRIGGKLVLQNDIGATEAHVLVLNIEERTATLTCSDAHRRRLAFLKSLLEPFAVRWSDHLAACAKDPRRGRGVLPGRGSFRGPPRNRLSSAISRSADRGSRIVFLIDWNRARKALGEFLPEADAVRLLKWAADNNLGHRDFLELGAGRLIAEAIEFAEPTSGLLQGRSQRFIRDELKVELARKFRSTHAGLLSVALSHAERVFDLASEVREGLAGYEDAQGSAQLERTARRARKWEQECDAVVSRIHTLAQRMPNAGAYRDLMHEVDEAADGLEEAAFLMTHLVILAPPPRLVRPVQELAALLVAGAQESVKMFEAARHVTREGVRENFEDFLGAVDCLVALEHQMDTAERVVTTAVLGVEDDARILHLLSRLSGALEGAADAMSRAALKLREHLLGTIMTG